MITYREFEIRNCEYGGFEYWPLNYDGPEDKRGGLAGSIQDAKDRIDEYYFDNTLYRVVHFIPHAGRVITKFTWLTDHNGEMGALSFASKVNGEIEMYIGGFQEELSF